jgi:predicted Fe-Mo cluster-binding NifX family protein
LNIRIAVASKGLSGLDDIVSQVFGRSSAFTIVDVKEGMLKEIRVEENPSANATYGAGPLTCMRLKNLGVNVAIGANFGPTVSAILKEAGIEAVTITPGTRVRDAIQQYLKKH